MLHCPPLTAERLAQIWDDHPEPVVLELLWEIHRLRATIGHAEQIRRIVTNQAATGWFPASVWECYCREFDAEPCLADKPTQRQQVLVGKILSRPREE